MLYMRNKLTSEIRSVGQDSPEFNALKAEVGPDGRPKWEQTGAHHATDVVTRAENKELVESDLGSEDQPLSQEVATDTGLPEAAPWENLTPGERKTGIKSLDQKTEELSGHRSGGEHRVRTLQDAADKIAENSVNPQLGTGVTPDEGQYEGKEWTLQALKDEADAQDPPVEYPGNATKAEVRNALLGRDSETSSSAPA